jgi:hypothetical protein
MLLSKSVHSNRVSILGVGTSRGFCRMAVIWWCYEEIEDLCELGCGETVPRAEESEERIVR